MIAHRYQSTDQLNKLKADQMHRYLQN